jgi:hypothetical protein
VVASRKRAILRLCGLIASVQPAFLSVSSPSTRHGSGSCIGANLRGTFGAFAHRALVICGSCEKIIEVRLGEDHANPTLIVPNDFTRKSCLEFLGLCETLPSWRQIFCRSFASFLWRTFL